MRNSRRRFLFNSAAALCLSAATRAIPAQESAPAGRSADQRLLELFDTVAKRLLEISPQPSLSDETPEGQARRQRAVTGALVDLQNFDSRVTLSLRGRLDYESVLFATRAEVIARDSFKFGRVDRRISPYVVNHLAGSYLDAPDLINNKRPPADGTELDVYVSRLRDFARNLEGECARIRSDEARGIVPPDFIIARTLTRMRSQLDKLAARSILDSVNDPSAIAQGILEHEVIPKLAQQIELVESSGAHATGRGGLVHLKNSGDCYSAALRVGATTEPNVEEFRREGLAEVHDLNTRADRLLKKIGLARGSIDVRLRKLASDERYLYPDTDAGKDRAVADMNARIRAILPVLNPLFNTPIDSHIEVRKLTTSEELAGRVGYRVAPALDGSRPGVYFVDLHAIRDRPTWSLPSVTYHETVPGHLLQLPRQEAAKLHPLRQQLNARGYFEGWAIYAEVLAQETGVYHDDPVSEIGFLQSRLFRVSRMLVDIGIHVNGWTREQAISTLMGMTAQPRALCETDVERYFVLPGMIGGDEIGYYGWRAARVAAKRNSGGKFDLAAFHERGLQFGPLPLPALHRATTSSQRSS